MATLMEKDVLMELATGFCALSIKDESQQAQQDRTNMGALYNHILFTEHKNIDYKNTLEEIKALRSKYE